MKKFDIKYLFIFLAMTFSLTCFPVCKEANALFDPGSMVTQVPNTIKSFANKVTTFANKIIKATLQAYKSIQDFFKNLFSKKSTEIPGTKQIVTSKVADIEDEASVRAAFSTLFFQYPSEDSGEQRLYEKEGEEFYEDTVIEVFTAVRELEKQLDKIDIKIATAETEYTKADSLNEGINNRYKIYTTTDQILTTIQELVAMKSQLVAAKAVLGEVKPLYKGSK